jgi:hypothetical protein
MIKFWQSLKLDDKIAIGGGGSFALVGLLGFWIWYLATAPPSPTRVEIRAATTAEEPDTRWHPTGSSAAIEQDRRAFEDASERLTGERMRLPR